MDRRFFSLVGLGLLAAGCASTAGRGGSLGAVKPESFGAFECRQRGDVASPPPRGILEPRNAKEAERHPARPKPLLTQSLCPDGQVPVAKTDPDALAKVAKGNPFLGAVAGTPADFFRRDAGEEIRRSVLPFDKVYGPGARGERPAPRDAGCNGIFYFGSCYYYAPAAVDRVADGSGMTMSLERPDFSGHGHTLDELAVQGGEGNGNIVEVGWNVSTSQYPDADPHLFVFHWINWVPTCYDGCGWQQYSATYFPGMNLRALVGREVYIGYVYYQGNWWAWFDNQWLGYFPGSEWSGTFTRSSHIQWFGEVSTDNGIPPNVEMGNGAFPTNSAAARMVTLCDVDAAAWVCWIRDMQSLGPTYPPYYDILRTGYGATRYGGPGS